MAVHAKCVGWRPAAQATAAALLLHAQAHEGRRGRGLGAVAWSGLGLEHRGHGPDGAEDLQRHGAVVVIATMDEVARNGGRWKSSMDDLAGKVGERLGKR